MNIPYLFWNHKMAYFLSTEIKKLIFWKRKPRKCGKIIVGDKVNKTTSSNSNYNSNNIQFVFIFLVQLFCLHTSLYRFFFSFVSHFQTENSLIYARTFCGCKCVLPIECECECKRVLCKHWKYCFCMCVCRSHFYELC